MCGCLFALDEHIIHIYLHVSPNLFIEHFVDQTLVGRSCIFQFEGHYLVAVEPLVADEGSLLLVFLRHFNLVVSRELVHECEKPVS